MDRASDDIRGNLRVAALQSRVGQILLARLPSAQREAVLGSSSGDGGEKYKSIVVAGRNKSWVNSDACLRIGRELSGPLRYLALLTHIIIPRLIRDIVYKFLSGQRTKLLERQQNVVCGMIIGIHDSLMIHSLVDDLVKGS